MKQDKIELVIVTDLELEKQKQFLKERTNAKKIRIVEKIMKGKYKNKAEEKIKEKKIKILFNKS